MLPWENIQEQDFNERIRLIGQRKIETRHDICACFPAQFLKYMDYVRGLEYDQTPDYNFLIGLF